MSKMRFKINKKGFTLIELIAVVVILGIISLIALPSVISYLSGTQQSAYSIAEGSVVSATYNMFADCSGDSSSSICSSYSVPDPNSYVTVKASVLIDGGYLDPISDPVNSGQYCDENNSYAIITNSSSENDFNAKLDYKVCLSCGDYQSSDCQFYEDRSDKIVNPADFSIEQCTNFNTFLTENGIDLHAKAVIFGENVTYDVAPNPDFVDTTKVGTVDINYKFGGLTAVTKVTVTDVTNPSKAGIHMTSGGKNYDGTSWTKEDVVVTFSATDDTVCDGVTVDGSGVKGYSYSKDNGATWNFVENGYTENTTFNGDVLVKVIDKEGNEGEINSFHIMLDKTPPTCVSSGGSSSWVNHSITIIGTCSDNGSGCVGNASKVYDTSTSINTTNAGPGTVYDKAGNATVCPTNQTVRIDKVAPTYTITPSGTPYGSGYQSGLVVNVSCSDGQSGIASGSQSPSFTTRGYHSVSGTCVDNAGNRTNYTSNNFLVYIYGANASICGTYSYQCGTHNCGYDPCGYQNICVEARPLNDGYGRWECVRWEYKATTVCGRDCPSYCEGTYSCWY